MRGGRRRCCATGCPRAPAGAPLVSGRWPAVHQHALGRAFQTVGQRLAHGQHGAHRASTHGGTKLGTQPARSRQSFCTWWDRAWQAASREPKTFWQRVRAQGNARLVAGGDVVADLLPGDQRALEALVGRVHLQHDAGGAAGVAAGAAGQARERRDVRQRRVAGHQHARRTQLDRVQAQHLRRGARASRPHTEQPSAPAGLLHRPTIAPICTVFCRAGPHALRTTLHVLACCGVGAPWSGVGSGRGAPWARAARRRRWR